VTVTQSPAAPASDTPAAPAPTGETFLAVAWRRTRYVVAIAVSAALFSWLGWSAAAPPPQWGGLSLLAWPGHGLLAALILTLILLVATGISSLIVHPDSPHMGLFCSLLGMTALSIRGGPVHMLLVFAQDTHSLPHVADLLALECVMWGCVILLADAFARFLHDRFLANRHWIYRAYPRPDKPMPEFDVGTVAGFAKAVSHFLHTDRIKSWVRIPLAMILSGALALLFLYVFMQSQLKGQVLMACFVSFFLATLCAYAAFPTVPFWSLILSVPLTAAVAFLIGRNAVPPFPGHAPFFALRALPIDYLTAGVPGAILGLYWGFAWALGSEEES
jgi:hypothetical protein